MRKQTHGHVKGGAEGWRDVGGKQTKGNRLMQAGDMMSQADDFLHLLGVCHSLGKKSSKKKPSEMEYWMSGGPSVPLTVGQQHCTIWHKASVS